MRPTEMVELIPVVRRAVRREVRDKTLQEDAIGNAWVRIAQGAMKRGISTQYATTLAYNASRDTLRDYSKQHFLPEDTVFGQLRTMLCAEGGLYCDLCEWVEKQDLDTRRILNHVLSFKSYAHFQDLAEQTDNNKTKVYRALQLLKEYLTKRMEK